MQFFETLQAFNVNMLCCLVPFSVTAQFLSGLLDANLCKNKQKQTDRTNALLLCLLSISLYVCLFVYSRIKKARTEPQPIFPVQI